jgi:hypothetical protein
VAPITVLPLRPAAMRNVLDDVVVASATDENQRYEIVLVALLLRACHGPKQKR